MDGFADGRYVNSGEANSVNASMIENGTITSADVSSSSTSGIYVARSQLYTVADTVQIANGDVTTLTVTCDALTDLPIAGGCSVGGNQSNPPNLLTSTANAWDETGRKPEWICRWHNDAGAAVTVIARIYCLRS